MWAVSSTTKEILGGVNLTPSAWDYIFIGLLILAAFLYALTLGKNRMMAVNLGVFFSYILTKAIPWNSFDFLAKNKPSVSVEIFIFLVVVVAVFFLLPKSSLTSAIRLKKRGRASWWQLWLLGVAQIGMVAAMIGSFLPAKSLIGLNPLVVDYIFSEVGLFGWATVNLLLMLFLKKRKSDDD